MRWCHIFINESPVDEFKRIFNELSEVRLRIWRTLPKTSFLAFDVKQSVVRLYDQQACTSFGVNFSDVFFVEGSTSVALRSGMHSTNSFKKCSGPPKQWMITSGEILFQLVPHPFTHRWLTCTCIVRMIFIEKNPFEMSNQFTENWKFIETHFGHDDDVPKCQFKFKHAHNIRLNHFNRNEHQKHARSSPRIQINARLLGETTCVSR